MDLHLVSTNGSLVECWQESFREFPEILIHYSNILEIAENTIVSPANSYGYMDGGIDDQYLAFFGLTLQEKVQKAIDQRPEGHLPVGAALLIETGHLQIPYLISAPTMVTPGPVPAANSFFAMAAMLKAAHAHRDKVTQVFCPGLATGVGCVPPGLAAEEMAKAYRKWCSCPSIAAIEALP